MMIRRMRATFGKLEDQTLELQPGLNLIDRSNEAGKSTWLAFLMAMFYGVPTRERAGGGRLPDKLKYLPWSGHAMAGTMELSDGERSITLERRSSTSPMGDFRAWDSETGVALEELTGKTCGKTLLGVEAEVYARSGFLLQKQIPVSADANLEKRLSALVTTGREEVSFAELDEKLKKMQSTIRHTPTGSLPQAREALARTEARLAEISAGQRRLATLQVRLQALRAERGQLRDILAGLDAREQRERQDRLKAAQAALDAAVEDRLGWESVCAELPDEETLQALQQAMQDLQADFEAAALAGRAHASEVSLPAPDPVFGYLRAQEARSKAEADASAVQQAQQAARPRLNRTPFWLMLLVFGLGLGLFGALKPLLSLVAAGSALALAGLDWWLALRIRYHRRLDAYLDLQKSARLILDRYQAPDAEGVRLRANAYLRSLEARANAEDRAEACRRLDALAERKQALLARLEALMPGCGSTEKAVVLFQEAAQSRQALERAKLLEAQRTQQLKDLRFALGDGAAPTSDAAPIPNAASCTACDRQTALQQLAALEQQIAALTSEADQLAGAISQMGDVLALSAQKEGLEQKILRLEDRLNTLHLARTTLSEADSALRARFAPLLCSRTGALFQQLTGGRYDRVQLDRELRVTVHPIDSPVFRPLSYLSGGTVDQLYLALRLAICELLLPQAPIVLDDALVYFDDRRAALALEVLCDLGKTRQILLFTCQGRERQLLNKRSAEKERERSQA